MTHAIPRRAALLGLSSVLSLGGAALAVANAPTDRRFVAVILRGALDGLAAVAPYGDPGLMVLRSDLVPPMPGQENGLLDLGGFYGLHPALPRLHALYQAHELAVIHAVAGPYRARSHFEAQDFLESGGDQRMTSGWLNRAAAALPAAPHALARAIAIGPTVPLLLRGAVPVANWAPHGFAEPRNELYQAIMALNKGDHLTGPAIATGMRDRGFGAAVIGKMEKTPPRAAFATLAAAAGSMLRAADGPRLAALEIGGWDTHGAQVNRLGGALGQLDAGLDGLRTALGETWASTIVLVMTEFGRTARMNGTKGTDHGTAGVAFVLGGAVAGGRVLGSWPGLSQGQLFENRDLAPTTDLRSVAKGILAGHLGLSPAALGAVFPGSAQAGTMNGLVRAV